MGYHTKRTLVGTKRRRSLPCYETVEKKVKAYRKKTGASFKAAFAHYGYTSTAQTRRLPRCRKESPD